MGLTALYAGVQASRLIVMGVLVDAVMIHFNGPTGRFAEKLDTAWHWFAGTGGEPPSARLKEDSYFLWFIAIVMAVFACAAVVMAVALFIKEYCAQLLIVRMTVDIRRALYSHLARQSVAYFNRQRSGDVISRLTNDVNAIQLSFRFFFEDIVQDPVTILAGLVVAALASPPLFVLTLPFYGILIFPVLRSSRKVIKHGRGRLERLGVVTEAIEQLFSGIRIVKAFGMEKHEEEAFADKNAGFIKSTMKMNRAKLRGRALQELFYNVGTAVLLLCGVLAITYMIVDASNFLVFLMALVQVYNPLKTMSRAWNQIQESRAGLDRVLEILRERPLIQDHDGSLDFPGVREEIRVENVSFSYKELDPISSRTGTSISPSRSSGTSRSP
jgi:subfamily B ATP-binding cassette protein MsbA